MIDLGRLIPKFWTQKCETNDAWDQALNYALDKWGVQALTSYEARVGPFTVWVANYPYSFGFNRTDPLESMPRVWTRIRLRRAIQKFQYDRYMEMMGKAQG